MLIIKKFNINIKKTQKYLYKFCKIIDYNF